jgi:voltage-gated potassium channel
MHPVARPTSENQRIRRTALATTWLVLGILVIGTGGYTLLEGWSLLDSLFMTVITLATIGYGEVHPLTSAGRVFTVLIIFIGVGTLGYALAEVTAFLAGGGVRAYRRRERMERMMENLRGHTMVCGCGRLGTALVEELHAQQLPFIVIDRDPRVVERLGLRGDIAFLQGDANDDQVLKAAGIDRANTLVAALNDDASNVFLTLSARVLTRETNPSLTIHGKAEDPASQVKLERAGANHVFIPGRVVGHRIAHQILRPAITELIGLSTRKGDFELGIEELLAQNLNAVGRSLRESGLWGRPELMVLAVKSRNGDVVFPPRPDELLQEGDRVVLLGRPDQLAARPGP